MRSNPEVEVITQPGSPEPILVDEYARSAGQDSLARLQLLWEKRSFLLRALAWGLLVFTLVAFLLPKRYQSWTRLMPPDDRSNSALALVAGLSGRLSGGLGAVAGDVLGGKSSGALFVGILNSRTVQDGLINKVDLRKVYGVSSWEKARRKLASNTAIYEDHKSGIITITVTDRNPQRAAAMAQDYVAELNTVVNQLSTSSASRERVFLEGRLAQVKQELKTAETDFSDFASQNAAIDIKEQGRAMVSEAATLQGQLIAAQSELEGLKQVYADSNVRVRSLKARIGELKAQLERLGGKQEVGDGLATGSDGALYPSIRKLPLLGVPYADLYRRTKVQEAVFETLTQEYELAKVAEAKETPSIKVLDVAAVPEERSFPPRTTILILGSLSWMSLAIAFVLARRQWERVAPEDPRMAFAQEVFRAINAPMPWAAPNGSRFHARAHAAWNRVFRRNQSGAYADSAPNSETR